MLAFSEDQHSIFLLVLHELAKKNGTKKKKWVAAVNRT